MSATPSTPTPTPTLRPRPPAPTATLAVAVVEPTFTPVPTATPAPTDVPPTPRPTRHVQPTAVPTIAPQPGRVLSAVLQPLNVEPQAALNATVQTSGSVDRVDVSLGSGVPGTSGPITITLVRGALGSWTGSLTAPGSPGLYHYTVGMYSEGRRTIIDNDNWNIKVLAPSTAAQPLPADIPLVPPFGWGNPVPATFSAEGRSINGSEVISSTRSDVTGSYVAQWYTNRLPAAGWTVDPSTMPARGATAFTMVATSGSRVCVVQYAAGTVHIFYG